jgi:hypothetical protein
MDDEEARLRKSYWEAVGWCLQYGILVYHPGTGGEMLSLGELRDKIAEHRGRTGPSFEMELARAFERYAR